MCVGHSMSNELKKKLLFIVFLQQDNTCSVCVWVILCQTNKKKRKSPTTMQIFFKFNKQIELFMLFPTNKLFFKLRFCEVMDHAK